MISSNVLFSPSAHPPALSRPTEKLSFSLFALVVLASFRMAKFLPRPELLLRSLQIVSLPLF
jgi:hypothetical protein